MSDPEVCKDSGVGTGGRAEMAIWRVMSSGARGNSYKYSELSCITAKVLPR